MCFFGFSLQKVLCAWHQCLPGILVCWVLDRDAPNNISIWDSSTFHACSPPVQTRCANLLVRRWWVRNNSSWASLSLVTLTRDGFALSLFRSWIITSKATHQACDIETQEIFFTAPNFSKWNNFHRENWEKLQSAPSYMLTARCALFFLQSVTSTSWLKPFWGKKITQPHNYRNSSINSLLLQGENSDEVKYKESIYKGTRQSNSPSPTSNILPGCDFCAGAPRIGQPALEGEALQWLAWQATNNELFFYMISFPKHAFCELLPARIIKWKLLCFDKCGVKLAMLQNIP